MKGVAVLAAAACLGAIPQGIPDSPSELPPGGRPGDGAAAQPRAAGEAPESVALAGAPETEERLRRLAAAAEVHERELARDVRRRDELLARVDRLQDRRSLPGRVTAWWRLGRTRGELEGVVARLQRRQARLLELRARREALLEQAEDESWARLEDLVARAAAAWEAGESVEPGMDPAVAEAFDVAGEGAGAISFARYRLLVDRLARVNTALADPHTSGPPAAAGAPESEFLGLADRGRAIDRPSSPAAWSSLRSRLAREIVAVASEITRRARA
ncbi:MAG: hypothetical protein ABR599_12380, partial [Gemmatimonadota bacterium]